MKIQREESGAAQRTIRRYMSSIKTSLRNQYSNAFHLKGLRWVAHGFSALGLSDHQILEREFIVYDALYAECRLRASSQ